MSALFKVPTAPACAANSAAHVDRSPARSVESVLAAPGEALDRGTRSFMESSFGHDFSHVRVHADERAGESAKALRANAYTIGNHIAFAPGRFRPDTHGGRRLIAHELAHVAQQRSNSRAVRPERMSNPADSSEREAGAAALDVMQGRSPSIQPHAVNANVLHRDTDDSAKKPESGGNRVSVSIAVVGECPNPRKIAEAIPGALSMLSTVEQFLMDYPFLIPSQRALIDGLLKAHFGTNDARTRNKVQGRIIHMTRLVELAGAAQLTFDCRPVKDSRCDENSMVGMWVARRSEGNVIHVCPKFYQEGLEGRRLLLIHETAHLSGAKGPEQYFVLAGPIGLTECLKQTPLAPEVAIENADSYAWFVWCLSRKPGDQVMSGVNVTAQPQSPGKKP